MRVISVVSVITGCLRDEQTGRKVRDLSSLELAK